MKKNFKGIILLLVTLICFISGGYFFSQTNLTTSVLLSMNLHNLLDSVISINFFCFVLLASIGVGSLISLSSFYEEKKAITFALTGYLISVLLTIIIFGLFEFVLILIFSAIAFPFAIKSTQKAREYRSYPLIRAGVYASSKIVLGLSISFFVGLILFTLPNAGELENNFADQFLSSNISEGITLSDDFTLKLAESISVNQVKTMELMLEQPELIELMEEGSINAITFHQKMLLYKKSYGDENYIQQIAVSLRENEIDFGEEIINQFKIINLMAKYAFLIQPFSTALMVLFIGNLLIKNIAGIVFVLIIKFAPSFEETSGVIVTEEKEN